MLRLPLIHIVSVLPAYDAKIATAELLLMHSYGKIFKRRPSHTS